MNCERAAFARGRTPNNYLLQGRQAEARKLFDRLPWKELDVDVALECTGIFTSKEKASAHLKAGARAVLVSAPADAADLTVVYGVNYEKLTKDHIVVSNAFLHHELPSTRREGVA